MDQRAEHYQGMAAQCVRLAQGASNETSKVLLLEMAQAWARLAEQVRAAELTDTCGLAAAE
jgi:hypothetical protein